MKGKSAKILISGMRHTLFWYVVMSLSEEISPPFFEAEVSYTINMKEIMFLRKFHNDAPNDTTFYPILSPFDMFM